MEWPHVGVVGGAARLAEQLGVTESQLADWLAGRGKPPNDIYLRALDLVASGPSKRSRRN